VAVAAAMMTGLGFSPFFAAAICLLANTAPVAFGSIGIPVLTLAGTTGLPAHELSMWVGRLCAPVSLFIPAYLMLVMSGPRGLKGVLPAVAVCGLCYASMQYLVSSYVGPELVDIVASLTAVLGLIVLLKTWQPVDAFSQYGSTVLAGGVGVGVGPSGGSGSAVTLTRHSAARVLKAWSPYLLLVFFVLLWGSGVLGSVLNAATFPIEWPGLHKLILRGVPVVAAPTPYPAIFTLNLLATSGSACAMATIVSAALLAVSPGRYLRLLGSVARQMAFSMLTIASVLGLAFLMNYSGATATLGLAFAATGFLFPFFSAMLGWVGVFLTGSDTSANALFGNLQVVTATTLGFNPLLMASANSAGGVMGKMISLQSLAVAVAATGMHRSQEARLFRFTFGHSLLLACVIGLITALYAHVL
jgi:lactate permease